MVGLGGWGWGYPWGFVLGRLSIRLVRLRGRLLLPYGPVYVPVIRKATICIRTRTTAKPRRTTPPPPRPCRAQPPPLATDSPDASGNEGLQYYNDARSAFSQGEYRDAMRLAGHAAVESPQNPKVHELLSLASFASGNYLAAATEGTRP